MERAERWRPNGVTVVVTAGGEKLTRNSGVTRKRNGIPGRILAARGAEPSGGRPKPESGLGYFACCHPLQIDGRTTGIEPARGGFTIHCLDPLGYIRPILYINYITFYTFSLSFFLLF